MDDSDLHDWIRTVSRVQVAITGIGLATLYVWFFRQEIHDLWCAIAHDLFL